MTVGLSRLVPQVTTADVVAALQVFARVDIRDLPPPAVEPFHCPRCLDTGTVADLTGWEPSWLWQRYRPVPRKPCPDCAGGARA